jgi:hypothetical protein
VWILAVPLLVAPSPSHALSRANPTTFGVGVQAILDAKTMYGWLPRTGAPIDYAYRYLGGGAGTRGDWTALMPNGTYPVRYASEAAAKGYTPVFTYYNILSTPGGACLSCAEAQEDLTNLNTPAVTAAYFDDFATLMKRLGPGTYDGVTGFAGDTIVHVEPDLSGYAQLATTSPASRCYGFCTGTGDDPALLSASVGSSGYPEAAGFEDTYRGFNQVLIHLRDTYAPNVRLAVHVSDWATGWDLNSSTDPTIDATALGTRAGTFAARSGAYDLVFNDVSNKDAAYYTYVLRKPRYWDQDNVVFPNFHRWEAYVRAVTTTTGLKAIVWQVPIGNQLYRSSNNTPGHWQDNRVEYFFGHVAELRDAGLIGMLFGTTQSDATNYWDAQGDGTTNLWPFCSSDGWSSGKVVCNLAESPAADDDGTYLRLSVIDYYKHPLPLA